MAKLREEAADARRDPAMLAAFKALRLNLGVDDVESSLLLSAELWEELASESPEADGLARWGVDLGGSAASSAVAAFWPATGLLRAVAAFPSLPPLGERGLRDGVGGLYSECERRGEVICVGEHAVSYRALLAEALARFGPPAMVSADRWRLADLQDAMNAVGMRGVTIEPRGQGYRDGGEDVRHFRRGVRGAARPPGAKRVPRVGGGRGPHLSDPAGNHKLAKASEGGRRMRARDDSAAASILAVSAAERHPVRVTSGVYLGLVG